MQAALQLYCDLGDISKVSADAVLQRALRAAAGVEHAAGHVAAACLCGNLGRRSEAAAAVRTHGLRNHPEASTAAIGDPWTRSQRFAGDGGHSPG